MHRRVRDADGSRTIVEMAKNKRRSAFVPRLLVRTAIAGVIPACALACSSSDSGPATADTGIVSGVADAAYGDTHLGVTDSPYRDTPAGVADAAYGDSDTRFGVADTAYPDTSHAESSGDPPAD